MGHTIIRFLSQQSDLPPLHLAGADTRLKPVQAFLIQLFGAEHPEFVSAAQYLDGETPLQQLLSQALEQIEQECSEQEPLELSQQAVWQQLCPAVVGCTQDPEQAIRKLRERRSVSVIRSNPQPLQQIHRELLFTSNILLTVPLPGTDLAAMGYEPEFCVQVAEASTQPQQYWYDHPIPVGISAESNEVLYGLKHLDAALAAEVERGNMPADAKADCVLSLSVTHPGLRRIAREYVFEEIRRHLDLRHLRLFLFTEDDCQLLLSECWPERPEAVAKVFGVDGAYGRHYSFLKAIAAVWQKLVNPQLRATFKIDLDQVFVQSQLIAETGQSMFEHLRTPLWGAYAVDHDGLPVRLGMLAGALVNQTDADKGLFVPDVGFPDKQVSGLQHLHHKQQPQAVSTVAEMMTRYQADTAHDGVKSALQRIHVTGGTNGILVDDLLRYQPMTPSFVGRAEDQAFILSALSPKTGAPQDGQPYLGYLHAAGLIMRHDKQGFAAEAIAQAAVGKALGDIERVLLFSAYAKALPQTTVDVRRHLEPFTGSFISPRPVTLAMLVFAYQALLMAEQSPERLDEYLQSGSSRLFDVLAFCTDDAQGVSPLARQVREEKVAWQALYSQLQQMPSAQRASDTVRGCQLDDTAFD